MSNPGNTDWEGSRVADNGIWLVAGLVAGGFIGFLIASLKSRSANQSLREEASASRALLDEGVRTREALKSEIQMLRQQLDDANIRHAGAASKLETLEKTDRERQALLEESRKTLTQAFQSLSLEALQQNSRSFLELAQQNLTNFQNLAKGDLELRQAKIDEIVKPLSETLGKVDSKLQELEGERKSAYASLNEMVRSLVETHIPRLHSETMGLVKALRQPVVRGRWGEIQLRRVVEMAGMLEHCDFLEQQTAGDEERLRPDLIIRLPGNKQVVVDAKAPLSAYLEAAEAESDEARGQKLLEHARQVRQHIAQLGRKSYWEQFQPAPEFVILFLPGEMFYSSALQADPGLIEYGVTERVIPATPTTLIALLRAVAYGWQQETIAKNAQEISEMGRELYKRITDFTEHWAKVGKALGSAVESYNRASGTLERRVLVTARRLKALRSGTEEEIPVPAAIDSVPRPVTPNPGPGEESGTENGENDPQPQKET
ncbi:MAG: DNA recombination protein RmuC [Leptospirillum sp.]